METNHKLEVNKEKEFLTEEEKIFFQKLDDNKDLFSIEAVIARSNKYLSN